MVKTIQKVFWVCFVIACAVLFVWLIPQTEPYKIAHDKEKPVIVGVKDSLTVDVAWGEVCSQETMEAAALEGVTAEDNLDTGRRTPHIFVRGYDDMGNQLSEFPEGTYRIVYRCQDRNKNEADPVEILMTVKSAEAPGLTAQPEDS